MSVIFKAQPGSLEFPATFYVDLIEAIDQDVGDAGIFQKRLERAQAEDFIQNFPRKALTLGEAERYGFTVNSIADEQQHLFARGITRRAAQFFKIEPVKDFAVEIRFNLLILGPFKGLQFGIDKLRVSAYLHGRERPRLHKFLTGCGKMLC